MVYPDTLSGHLLQGKGRKHHSQLRKRVHQEIVVTLVSPAINMFDSQENT